MGGAIASRGRQRAAATGQAVRVNVDAATTALGSGHHRTADKSFDGLVTVHRALKANHDLTERDRRCRRRPTARFATRPLDCGHLAPTSTGTGPDNPPQRAVDEAPPVAEHCSAAPKFGPAKRNHPACARGLREPHLREDEQDLSCDRLDRGLRHAAAPRAPPPSAYRCIAPRAFFLRPVLSRRERWAVRGFLLCWLATMVSFWSWWLSSPHWATAFGMALSSVLVLMVLALPVWLFFAVSRLTVPRLGSRDSPMVPAANRAAFVFTKTPSEPWALVRSIEGALAQVDVPPFDVWLADEAPAEPALSWCRTHGIRVISPHGITTYHRPTRPRRTGTKEGNLAYFYDQVGYDSYDIVCQFDADHMPETSYLRQILAAFADPRVGYVAAPSICGRNARRSWAARGRLYREATLHGPVQAGQNDGYAPTCIGSHYAVRTAALQEIGGVGPELAEDFSTSFLMHAHGWKGVLALDAIANGDGPDTVSDAMTQELQWSRSLTLFLLRYTWPHWTNLQPSERYKLAYAQLWYPLFAVQMVVGFVFPILALATGTPWVKVNLVQYLVHSSAPGLVLVALVFWLSGKKLLRPVDAKVVSWEAWLFELARWPWIVLGVSQAVLAQLLQREFSFKVTPKASGRQPLAAIVIGPYCALSAISCVVGLTLPTSPAEGYRFLVIVNALTYATVTVAIAALHWKENGRVRGVVSGVVVGTTLLGASAALFVRHQAALASIVSTSSIRDAATEGIGPYLFLGALALAVTGYVRTRRAGLVERRLGNPVGSRETVVASSTHPSLPNRSLDGASLDEASLDGASLDEGPVDERWWQRALVSAVLAYDDHGTINHALHGRHGPDRSQLTRHRRRVQQALSEPHG